MQVTLKRGRLKESWYDVPSEQVKEVMDSSNRLKLIIMLILSILVVVLVDWVSSPTTIIPPAAPVSPVTVYIVEGKVHARLVLPTSSGSLMQYAYGDWRYYALNERSLGDGIRALLIPTPGALGRRKYESKADLQNAVAASENGTLFNFKVSQAEVTQLLQSLDDRFNQNSDTQVYNPLTHMSLVRQDDDYTLWHNSNHELVNWLQDLSCEVEGFVLLADFQVQRPD